MLGFKKMEREIIRRTFRTSQQFHGSKPQDENLIDGARGKERGEALTIVPEGEGKASFNGKKWRGQERTREKQPEGLQRETNMREGGWGGRRDRKGPLTTTYRHYLCPTSSPPTTRWGFR
jgi:hypothetical protein